MAGFSSSPTRWMGLDVGSKTIGVAVTDPLKLTARPLTTLLRQDLTRDAKEILRLSRDQQVDRIILGNPRHLGGEISSTLNLIEPLAKLLEQLSSLEIRWVDERLSTKEAEELMAEAGLKLAERKKRRNEFAAAVILKRHLEENQ